MIMKYLILTVCMTFCMDQEGTDGDDADLPDGSPVPVESEAGDDSSDAAVSADANPANDATRKRTRASTKAVKKARVVSNGIPVLVVSNFRV